MGKGKKPGAELALMDRHLLKAAANGWSGEDIAAKYDIGAAEAILRIKELLNSRNIFTDIERKQLLLYSAYELKEQLEDNVVDLDDTKQVTAYLKVLSTLGDMLDKQGRITEAEMEAAARAQARALLQLIDAAYGRVREWLQAEYGDLVPVPEMDAMFQNALREIAAEEDE